MQNKILGRHIWRMNKEHNNNDTRDWYALTPKERIAYRKMATILSKIVSEKVNAHTYHTPECIQKSEDMDIALDLYALKFPKACKECKAKGVIEEPETYDEPGSSGECALCLENGLCPRCASDIGYESQQNPRCPECKWNGPDDGFPLQPDPCDCPDVWKQFTGIEVES